MNWTEIRADWGPMRRLLRSYWSALTPEDLDYVAGDRGRLVERLGARYRLDAGSAERAACIFEKDVRRPGAVK